MGLIARRIEADGIPTTTLSSALSITRSVKPPRATFVDFPLGHTAGKPGQPDLQRSIVTATLEAVEELRQPGAVRMLPHHWSDDDEWKLEAMQASDGRTERLATPVWQRDSDRQLAEAAGDCADCISF